MYSADAVGKTSPATIDTPADAAGVFAIWPGVAPGSENWTRGEQAMRAPNRPEPAWMIRNVARPTLTVFRPKEGRANGTGIIIAPGGAFCFLMVDHEGYEMARWLAGLGVTAFVLKYRLAETPSDDADMPAFRESLGQMLPRPERMSDALPLRAGIVEEARDWAEADGVQAVRFVRRNAGRWGLRSDRIGIAGFSAGGGVTVAAATRYDTESRPDFAAPIYPAHRPTGPIPADAPPLFVATADDDPTVPPLSTVRLYEAWRATGQMAELHVFSGGGHGFGMTRLGTTSDGWVERFRDWLQSLGLMG